MNRIRQLRLREELKQSDLASRLEVGQNTISNWENGKTEPDYQSLKKMAEIFDVSIDFILGREKTEKTKKIKMRRIQCGFTKEEMAERLGVNQVDYSKYETGQLEPDIDTLQKISGMLSVPPAELLEDWVEGCRIQVSSDDGRIEYAPTGLVPILGRIPAGYPLLAEDAVEGYEPVTVPDPQKCFYLRVTGRSMIGAGITDGDLVLIRKQETADQGQIVACRVNGDEATLKRFRQQGDMVFLMPENPEYEPIIVPASEFSTGYAQIIGVALEVKRKL